MVTKVNTIVLHGVEIKPVEVQIDISPGLFDFSIVGMASKEIIESKRRIFSAIRNSGFIMPMSHITVNLAPADLIKTSTGLDLPIAVGILKASRQININLNNKIYWGELALDGKLESTKGVMAIVLSPEIDRNSELYIPLINASEAGISNNRKILLCKCLRDISAPNAENVTEKNAVKDLFIPKDIPDIDLINNPKLIRALTISVAGRHNLLAIGPAGVGRSYLLKLVEYLSDKMAEADFLEVNRIYSVAGLNQKYLIYYPPFRTPHHSITQAAFIGGGTKFKVGEITLAHKGFLMLDEFNLFSPEILNMLRQPLEEKQISLQRGNYDYKLPCDFTLLATMNPCPCGNLGSKTKECKCNNQERVKYWHRLNKPILDRIDMQIYIGNNLLEMQNRDYQTIKLKDIKLITDRAIKFKMNRAGDRLITPHIHDVILDAVKAYEMSIRGMKKVVGLANTIADLEGNKILTEYHISEALNYRMVNYDGSTSG